MKGSLPAKSSTTIPAAAVKSLGAPALSNVAFRKSCPICAGTGRLAFAKHGIPISDCAACSHRFADYVAGPAHIANVYGDSYFEGGAGEYAEYDMEGATLRARGAWYGRLLRRHSAGGSRVLDIGAASGHILEGLRDSGWTGVGIEPNGTMAARARARGLDVRESTLENVELDERMDAVMVVQVLQHVPDLRAAIERARDATADGGIWLIEAWDRESVVARVLGSHWHAYNPPSVLHWLSKASLRALLAEYGFTYLESGRPPKSISIAHAKSVLKRDAHSAFGRAVDATAALVPDGLHIPYPGDDVFWMAFRKSATG